LKKGLQHGGTWLRLLYSRYRPPKFSSTTNDCSLYGSIT